MKPSAQFQIDATRVSGDEVHRGKIARAMNLYAKARADRQGLFQDWEAARAAASAAKKQAVDHLDESLLAFEKNATARGTKVHWATDSAKAREIVKGILDASKARCIIKSKVMTSEEIHLNAFLEENGFSVLESDLGEFIQQLKEEAPYHFVFPCMHLSREEISDLFTKELGTAPSNSPEELTMIARRWLRRKYVEADVGFTGANFLVADTGMISITENEGNARLVGALPRVMISLVGIEKVLPSLDCLAWFLPMLATAGTGQALTCYNTFYSGPRQEGEVDGPEEWHVILLDNHRTTLLADPEQRDALHCIRCGACLNVCPIFKNIGGLSYNTTYQGPIGSVITPHFRGLQDWKHLSGASSLCGACTATCPVKIDLHHHLLQNRRNAMKAGGGEGESFLWRLFGKLVASPRLFRLALRLGRLSRPFHKLIQGGFLDPAKAWTKWRDVPEPAAQTFRDWWRDRP